ncbi:hypothetical protein P9Y32_07610, partial [Bacillus cereus]|nr:hypothetical protein [Bacillus cereus]
ITIAYYYATSFDSETKTIKREDVVNIEILDMIDGVIQEDTNTSRPTTLKSMLQEKPIQTAKDYSLDSRLVKVTTDASEMYFKFIDNVDEKDVVLRGMGEDDRPYVIPYYRILDIEVVPKVLENVESNDDGLKLGEIEVGKHYGLEDKVINIVTEDGDYLVYGVSEIEGDSMYCMTTDYDNIEIPLRDVRHVAMHTRYNLEKWGIVPSLDYSTENMYVKVTFNNGETVVADSVSHIDVIYYRLLDAVGKPVKVSCENVRNMEVHERGNHMPVSKGIKLLMVGNVKIGTDYSEEEKEIIVKTSNVKHIFKLCVGVSTGNESIAFLNHEDIRKDVPVSDILKVYLKDIKTTGLKAIPLNLNSEPSTEKEETPHEDDFDVSDLFNLTDDVFEYYGVEEGKDYRKESKLLQVKLEDNVLVFANLESDMEGWVAGRQFGSITTSVPVSKIKDIKVVDIADLM